MLLKEKQPQWLLIKDGGSFRQMKVSWDSFINQYSGELTYDIIAKYKDLLDTTNEIFISVKNDLEYTSNSSSLRTKSTQEEQARLGDLSTKRSEVRREYEKALTESPRDEEKIQKLKRRLEVLGMNFVETKKTLDDIKTDSAKEEL